MIRHALTAAVLALSAAAPARAALIFSNLGPGDTWDRGMVYNVTGAAAASSPAPFFPAHRFTPAFDAELTSIELPLGIFGGTNRIDVQVRTSATNTMGQLIPSAVVLETFTFTGLTGPFNSAQTLSVGTSVLRPDLAAGTTYWLVAVPGGSTTAGGWNFSSPLQTGQYASSTDGGNTWVINRFGRNEISAFRVNGDPLGAAAVPEPASLAGLAVGGLVLAGARRLRRHG